MKLRLALLVPLLVTMVASFADAEWEYLYAKPQRFASFDNYVIAVGTKDRFETVYSPDVEKALRSGKEIRLRFAEIVEGIEFSGEVEQDVYFYDTKFSGPVYFYETQFSGMACFGSVEFIEEASFIRNGFTDGSFSYARFRSEACFEGAKFSEVTFWGAQFQGEVTFENAEFAGEANFSFAIFSKKTDLSWSRFNGVSFFRACLYPKNDNIDFSDVIGFSHMLIEWEYDAEQFCTRSPSEVSRRGLKGHLEYNETFYTALIKNYQEMGWFSQADDAYYTYRKEKRKRRSSPLCRGAELVLLQIPFGYGVKWPNLLYSFLFLWIPLSFHYARFLHGSERRGLGRNRYRSWFLHKFRRFSWALIYSLDSLVPGFDLHPLRYPEVSPYTFTESKSRKIIWTRRGQKILGWYLFALFLILFGKIWIR